MPRMDFPACLTGKPSGPLLLLRPFPHDGIQVDLQNPLVGPPFVLFGEIFAAGVHDVTDSPIFALYSHFAVVHIGNKMGLYTARHTHHLAAVYFETGLSYSFFARFSVRQASVPALTGPPDRPGQRRTPGAPPLSCPRVGFYDVVESLKTDIQGR